MTRLAGVRYAGLGGSCLLAVAAWAGGALPGADQEATPLSVAQGRYGILILACWLVGTAVQGCAWWAARDREFSPRWARVTAALWAVPFFVVPPLGSRDVYSYACQGQLYARGMSPYDHGVQELPCSWLETVAPIWRDTPSPYGPVFVVVAAAVISSSLVTTVVLFRVLAVAGLLAVAACLPILARRCGVPVQRALWVSLAGPLVGAHLIAGAHNDALMVGLVVAGLALAVHGSQRPIHSAAAGVVLGLAVMVKATALVAVPFAVLIAAGPACRRLRVPAAAAMLAGGAAVAMAGVTALSGLGLGWAAGLRQTGALVQFTSPPTAVGMTLTYLGRPFVAGFDAVPAVRVAAFVVLVALLIGVWLRAGRAPDRVPSALRGVAHAFALVVLLAPVFQPWYVLWPLVLLAATTVRTRPIMAVAVVGALSVLPNGNGLARFVKFPGAVLLTAALLVTAVVVLRRRRRGRLPAADSARPEPRLAPM